MRRETQEIYSALFESEWDFDRAELTTAQEQGHAFEQRGISLSTLRQFSEASKEWNTLRRVLLRSGETAIILETTTDASSANKKILSVQIRRLDKENVLQREYEKISEDDVFCDIVAAVGERIFVRELDRNYTRRANKKTATHITELFEDNNCIPILKASKTRASPAKEEEVVEEEEDFFSNQVGWVRADAWSSSDMQSDTVMSGKDVRLMLATVVGFDTIASKTTSKKSKTYPLFIVHKNNPSVDANHGLPYLTLSNEMIKHGKNYDFIRLDPRMTTKDVTEEFIKPMTRRCQTSMIDMFASKFSSSPSSITTSRVGPAEAFISHAWKYSFTATVDAINSWFETTRVYRLEKEDNTADISGDESCFLWFDIFTVAQHASAQAAFPPNYFFNQFRKGIESIGCTVLVLLPFLNPLPLKRSWCVWEIYCTISGNILFETALSKSDQRLRNTSTVVSDMECKVEAAEAWSLDDQEKILNSCKTLKGGCEHVNQCILGGFSYDQVRHSLKSREKNNFDIVSFSSLEFNAMAVDYLCDHFSLPLDATTTTTICKTRKPISWFGLMFVTVSKDHLKQIISTLSHNVSELKTCALVLPLRSHSCLGDDCYQFLGDCMKRLKHLKKIILATWIEPTRTQNYPGILHFLKALINLSSTGTSTGSIENIEFTLKCFSNEELKHSNQHEEKEKKLDKFRILSRKDEEEMNPIIKAICETFAVILSKEDKETTLTSMIFKGDWCLDDHGINVLKGLFESEANWKFECYNTAKSSTSNGSSMTNSFCIKKKILECPKKHDLIQQYKAKEQCYCDVDGCYGNIEEGSVISRCHSCNYNVCNTCSF